MRIYSFIATAALSIGSLHAGADELINGWTNPYAEPKPGKNCGANEASLAECEHKKMEHSTKYLAALTTKVAKAVPPESTVLFQKASAAWLQFRDASCQFEAAGAAGNSRMFRQAEVASVFRTRA